MTIRPLGDLLVLAQATWTEINAAGTSARAASARGDVAAVAALRDRAHALTDALLDLQVEAGQTLRSSITGG